jgi:hypothetical protein
MVVLKNKDEKTKKTKKNWVDGEVLHFIALREEMELEFAQKRKKNII